jgi:hypothetical protein
LSDIDERKTFMLDRLFYRLFQISKFGIDRMRRECASCMFRELYRIKWESRIPRWRRLRDSTDRSGRTCLTSRESVIFIIKHDIRDIEISSARVDKVTHPDPISITITSDCDDRERWIDHLHTSGEWESTTMKRLSGISVNILTRLSATADS